MTRYSLGARDLPEVARRLVLIAAPTDRGDAIGIVGVVALNAQSQGRPMIEDDFAQDHTRSAVETASLLPQHDFGPQEVWERPPFASVEWGFAVHRRPLHAAGDDGGSPGRIGAL